MDEQDFAEQPKTLREYVEALARRKIPMAATLVAIVVVSAVVAYLLAPSYRSTATILIEEQEIPYDLVRTTISSYADQRIQVISQQVMTRANLMSIVEKYDLYRKPRRWDTNEEILTRMRGDIKLNLVNADVIDRRSGSRTSATIAFTLSYDGETAEKAQKVANELTSLYLNENLHLRQQKAAETSSFLSEETERLRKEIGDMEARLATFKRKNAGRLPELAVLNLQMRDRTDAEVMEIDRQLASLEERRFYLDAQLAQTKPYTPILSTTGERILDPEDRLRTLRAQVAGLSGIYSPQHPDLVSARNQIEALEREVGSPLEDNDQAKRLTKYKTDLAALREKYSDDHPDVVRLRQLIAGMEEAQKAPAKPAAETKPARKPENPAYVSLKAQIEAIDADARSLRQKKVALGERLTDLETRLAQTPQVEREYLDLVRDRENSVTRYRELKAKLMEADIAQELEKERKSERFSLIDPPQYPEKPRSPNRPAILLIGLALGVLGGAG
jgi:succinoglycan biosynthesis transport protein ExoP